MSGRRLGRLLGSLLALAAVLGVLIATSPAAESESQLSDIVWTMAASH